jgi:hypothetical protein
MRRCGVAFLTVHTFLAWRALCGARVCRVWVLAVRQPTALARPAGSVGECSLGRAGGLSLSQGVLSLSHVRVRPAVTMPACAPRFSLRDAVWCRCTGGSHPAGSPNPGRPPRTLGASPRVGAFGRRHPPRPPPARVGSGPRPGVASGGCSCFCTSHSSCVCGWCAWSSCHPGRARKHNRNRRAHGLPTLFTSHPCSHPFPSRVPLFMPI